MQNSKNFYRRKGIYILPNLFTLSALFGGFFAIIMASNDKFELAAMAIFCAGILDSLDGRVARMTNTQSAFGEQMDSLADMVSFGLAPALVAYEWMLKPLGRWGWVASFIYCACTALRLARFNVNTSTIDKKYFQGIPSPAAAGLIAGFIWLGDSFLNGNENVFIFNVILNFLNSLSNGLNWTMLILTLLVGFTMVSNIPYYSFKDFSSNKSLPFIYLVLIVFVIASVAVNPSNNIFLISFFYLISGYFIYGWKKYKGKYVSIIATSKEEPDEKSLHED